MTWAPDNRHARIARTAADLLAAMGATDAERAAVVRCADMLCARAGKSGRPRWSPKAEVPAPDDALTGLTPDLRREALLGSAAIAMAAERIERREEAAA